MPILALLVLISAAPPPATRSVDRSAEEALKTNGLTRVGSLYLLEVDAKLQDSMREIRRAEAQLQTYVKKRRDVERDIAAAKRTMRGLLADRDVIKERMKHTGDARKYNEMVDQLETLQKKADEGADYAAKRENDLQKMVAPDDIVTATLTVADRLEQASARYTELGKNPDITTALEKLNQASKVKFKLGPSEPLKTELARLVRKREQLKSSAIPCVVGSGSARVNVSINGSEVVPMVVDTGADVVLLTAEVAARLNLPKRPDDEQSVFNVADGGSVKARVTTLQSIRVGRFTVRDVRCAILPGGRAGDCLLGGTFLRNFIVRLDLAGAELHLTPTIEGTDKPDGKPGATAVAASGPRPPQATIATSPPSARPPGKSAPVVPTPQKAPSASGPMIDLLAGLNVNADPVRGTWKLTPQGLMCNAEVAARINLPHDAPAEYDLRIEFTRTTGNGDVFAILPLGNAGVEWAMGAWGNSVMGFQVIDGKELRDIPDTFRASAVLQNGKRYTTLVKVREHSVSAYLDGKLVESFSGDVSRLSVHPNHAVRPNTFGIGAHDSVTLFHKVELLPPSSAPIKSSGEPAASTSQPTAAAGDAATAPRKKATIDLLPLVDPVDDAVQGKWQSNKGVLTSSGEGQERIELPYEPPAEYDYEVEFVRRQGKGIVLQILTSVDRPFIWVMGTGPGDAQYTFHYLKGGGDFGNKTSTKFHGIDNGREYKSVLKVRKDGVKAYLNGRLIASWDTDFSDADPRPYWALRTNSVIGLGTGDGATEFRRARVVEISGPGKVLRELPPKSEAARDEHK